MNHENVGFPGSQGARLAGRIDAPEGEPAAYALFAHCFTCSKDLKSAGAISRELVARGIAVLRFDFTGLGASGGEFADTNFTSNVEDLVAAADFLRRERQAPALLVGHSLGGTAMLAAAARIPEAVAVATIGAPSDTRLLRAKLAARLPQLAGDSGTGAAPRRAGLTAEARAAEGTGPGVEEAGQGVERAAEGTEDAVEGVKRAGQGAVKTAEGVEEAVESVGQTEEPAFEINLGGPRPVRIRRQLLEDLAGDHLGGVLAGLGKALLLFHSPADRIVGIEQAERLFLAARHPKSFVSLGDADHLLSNPRDASQAGAVLAAWATRYLAAGSGQGSHVNGQDPHAGQSPHAIGQGPGKVGVVTGTGIPALPATLGAAETGELSAGTGSESPLGAGAATPSLPALAAGEVEVTGGAPALRQEVRVGGHRLVADEPVADGGADAGPTPYGLLLAALGTCTGMTLRLYADRKGMPLTGTRVRLRHSRDHRVDCEQCAESGARIERIDRQLELLGPLSEEQRARLLAIADRCPVHRTLTSHVEVVTRLV
ncbi:MAG TPA: alpha/beta fold hydrolase [Thermoanaerobaculia bacterium]|nr:alpha/beta fold hydrolase [Thermoanaerobaculia bacterium]